METITMYELLGLVKDGKAPKKIKYHDKIYNYEEFNVGYGKDYFNAEWKTVKGYRHTTNNNSYIYLNINDYRLNDEVEIIEEEKKIPEKLGVINYCEDQATSLIHHKVDEIIDYLDYLNSKGDE